MLEPKVIVAGKPEIKGWYNQMRTVYDPDGIAPTLCACMGNGGDKVKIIIKESKRDNDDTRFTKI